MAQGNAHDTMSNNKDRIQNPRVSVIPISLICICTGGERAWKGNKPKY